MKQFFARPLALAIHQAIFLGVIATSSIAITQTVNAKETLTYNYNIPAMSLDRAISLFSAQSRIVFAFDPIQIQHLQSKGLKGSFSIDAGFKALLSPHGLYIQKTTQGYVIAKIARPQTDLSTGKKDISNVVLPSIHTKANSSTQSGTQISRAEIDRYGNISAGDLFKGVAGVQVGDSRNGGGVDINIRGIQGQSRIAVTVDGSQQALDTYRGYGGTQQRSYFDPDLISQVDITKGPSGAASPTGGIGGTVAMSTLKAKDILLADQKSGVRITGEFLDNSVNPAYKNTNKADGVELTEIPHSGRGNFLNNSAKAGTAAFAWTSDTLDIVAAYAKRKQGNYFTGKHGLERYRIFDGSSEQNSTAQSYAAGEEVLNTSAETESWLLKGTLRPKEGHELELSYRRFDGKYGEIMPSDIFRSGTAGIYQYPLGEIKMDTLSARYVLEPENNDLIHLKANAWWNQTKSDQLNGSFFSPSSQEYMSDRSWVRMDNERIGGDISNRFDFPSKLGLFSLSVGSSFQHENISPQKNVLISESDIQMNKVMRDGSRTAFNMNAQLNYSPVDKLNIWAGTKFSKFSSQDKNKEYKAIRKNMKAKQVRAYKKEGEWGDSMYWFPDENGNYTDATDPRLNNAIVFSNTNNPYDGTPYNEYGAVGSVVYDEQTTNMVVGFSHKEALSSKDHGFAPAFGINYEILPQTNLYASYTEGLRMPSLFETTFGTQQVSPIIGLKPERSRVWEIGANTSIDNVITQDDSASFKIAYFDTKIKNYITRYYDSQTFGAMYMTNADSYSANGLEFQSSYNSNRFFTDLSATYYLKTETCDAKFAQHLRLTASEYQKTYNTPNCTAGSYMGSYTNTQNPPKFSANITLGQHFLDQKLTVGGRVSYMSGPTEVINQPWQTGATTPQIEYQPVTLLDAFVSYKLNKNMTLNTSLQNITNRYYLDALAQSFMPSPGRTFKTGFTVKF